jgi:hypothetical protein
MSTVLTATLVACEPPRAPEAVVALGGAARTLALRLLALDDAALGTLTCAGGDGAIVVRGPAEQLPWVDGAIYLAPLPGALELLVPTHQAPDVPAAVAIRALRREGFTGRLGWLRDADGRDVIVALEALAPPGRAALAAFARGGAP